MKVHLSISGVIYHIYISIHCVFCMYIVCDHGPICHGIRNPIFWTTKFQILIIKWQFHFNCKRLTLDNNKFFVPLKLFPLLSFPFSIHLQKPTMPASYMKCTKFWIFRLKFFWQWFFCIVIDSWFMFRIKFFFIFSMMISIINNIHLKLHVEA